MRFGVGAALQPLILRGNDLDWDAHRCDGQRFVVHADEKLTSFLELEAAIRVGSGYSGVSKTVIDNPSSFCCAARKCRDTSLGARLDSVFFFLLSQLLLDLPY